jgi:hypothetical protein
VVATREVTPGVIARHGTSPFAPSQIPDLTGVKDRAYLDHTGLVRHRSIADFMRYAAMVQGTDYLSTYDGLRPQSIDPHSKHSAATAMSNCTLWRCMYMRFSRL